MSAGYTPTTGQVRATYIGGTVLVFGADGQNADEEFDRWLAAHDREVAAKALEDAGADWHALVMREKPPVTGATWLNRRAAAIRAGDA